jgi:hypothetical protein
LGNGRDHTLRFAGLAKFSHDEQGACETFLAVFEELVNEIFLGPDSPKQNKFEKYIRELLLFVK